MNSEPMRSRRALERLTASASVVVLVLGLMAVSFRLGERSGPAGTLPEGWETLAELYQRVTAEAVEVPEDEELLQGALRGMLAALGDPYATYYDPEAFASFNELLDGSFSGVGLMLEQAPDGLTVVRVIDGTPAAEAGVEVGERIVSVDGEDTRDLPVEVVVRRVQGEEGTPVRLGLEGGEAGPRELEIVRARIQVPNVEARVLPDGSGYVQLMQFTTGASVKVREAIEDLLSEGADGVVLDLRGNPGGLLGEAVRVASLFIPEGTIVTVEERDRRDTFAATGDAFEDLPLVVLVDRGSASASEIVAAAVQDYQRAQLVGATTFGKGSVQAVRLLADGSGVKFTTAQYFTPSGDAITGLVPDREISDPDEQLAVAQELLRAIVASGRQAA